MFLAEIVSFLVLTRLEMKLRDVDDQTIPLFFYTERRGGELGPALVQEGYTVAVLYPQRHNFQFAEPGIRHESPKDFEVLWLPTPELSFVCLTGYVRDRYFHCRCRACWH